MPIEKWNIRGLEKQKKSDEQKGQVVPTYAPPPPALPMTEKNAKHLLSLLINEHHFNIVEEVVKLYRDADTLENILEGMKIKRSIIKDLLKYCFPVIASEQPQKESAGVKINFNLHTNKGKYDLFDGEIVSDADYSEEN